MKQEKNILQIKKNEESAHPEQVPLAVRHLKVQPFYPPAADHKLLQARPVQIVSQLRLCGKWLQNAGFQPDDHVSVTVMDGLLVIRLTPKTEED